MINLSLDKLFLKIKEISEKYDKFYGTTIMLTNHTPFPILLKGIVDFDVDYKYEK